MVLTQRLTQICLFLISFIGVLGGILQMWKGEPHTTPELDNVHRFLAGIYLACGIISFWTALTIRKQHMLVFLLAGSVLMGALGRAISMNIVGVPNPKGLWYTYFLSEIIIPILMIVTQLITSRRKYK
ncbi:DUF4345 domain-containing protein [Chryseobacterium fistulae]|uniref:DUF4345 domain-containing protein n=1 Tax=Chryseobacterium fistulae TaxID=2675058 RepID=A0A6N4XT80_9FLAO|nr:DUF4345 domain-containing protein [Chryseobacterium fistulae]CAA7389932.1 hypothetical protein CHRY9393_02228 [Chryseobacterium fistulae]